MPIISRRTQQKWSKGITLVEWNESHGVHKNFTLPYFKNIISVDIDFFDI